MASYLMPILTAPVDENTKSLLSKLAKKLDRSMSSLVREAIRDFLVKHGVLELE